MRSAKFIFLSKHLLNGKAVQWSAHRKLFENTLVRGVGSYTPDPQNIAKAGTMNDVKIKMMERVGLVPGYVPIPKSREHLLKYTPKMEELPPRSMADSFTSALIPLSTSKSLQDKYVTFLGHVRFGRLMEDMDMFAVWVCHQHINMPNLPENVHLPYTFVTIMVDKVDFTDFTPKADEDIRLSGHVSWVGKTSMEIVVWLEQKVSGKYERITRALFLMAARNATNTQSSFVNPLKPATTDEEHILAGGEARKMRRLEHQKLSLFKVEPNDFEQTLMHDMFTRTTRKDTAALNSRILPHNARWMSEFSIENTIACFPENRNAHNKVFGGFLMRNALEVSWVRAYLYAGTRPKLEHICDISFEKPVDVSSFLQMKAYVAYTEVNYLVVMIVADILNPNGNRHTSNVFYYIYKCNENVPEIIPRSYHETMWYLMGRRKLIYALDLEESKIIAPSA